MSTFRDRGVIDITLVEDDKYVLVILDDMEWEFGTRQDHGYMLQNKINDYLSYVCSGQAEEAKPGLRPVIRILAQYFHQIKQLYLLLIVLRHGAPPRQNYTELIYHESQ